MHSSRWAIALTSAFATAFLNFASPAIAAGCGPSGYAYAGMTSTKGAAGLSATVTVLGHPLVQNGHVAAWIGFGGPTEGPGGTAEWIQTGLNSVPGSGNKLYIEIAHPGGNIDYKEVDSDVPVGTPKRLTITEVAASTWQVSVDGTPASAAVYLPSSHGALTPMAVAENWDGGASVCNRFAYKFGALRLVSGAASWHVLQDPGYRVVRQSNTDFSALTQLAPPDAQPARAPAAAAAPATVSQPAPTAAAKSALGTN